jgi:small-conductance mechanosensitive channel
MNWNTMMDQWNQILGMQIVELGDRPVTLGSTLAAILILLASWLLSRVLRKGARRALSARGIRDEGTTGVVSRLLHYAVLGIGIGLAIQAIGLDIGTFFAAGAIFAVGLGFAMQNIAQNFVSGVILLAERAIKPGDVLEVNGLVVKVQSMGIRATVVRSLDGEDIIVPNSSLVQSPVKNYTLKDSVYRLRAAVGVTYSSDMKKVRETLESTVQDIDWQVEDRDPIVLLTGYGSSSVDWEVSVWISDPWLMRRRMSELYQSIWWALKEQGLVIAFPQVDVHFDPPVADGITQLCKKAS